jgi:hypothetical protein
MRPRVFSYTQDCGTFRSVWLIGVVIAASNVWSGLPGGVDGVTLQTSVESYTYDSNPPL